MYLLAQIWIYLAAAFGAGALAGYAAWAWCQRRTGVRPDASVTSGARAERAAATASETENDQETNLIRRELEAARREAAAAQAGVRQRHETEIARLQAEIVAFRNEAETRAAKEKERHAAELAELHRQIAASRLAPAIASAPRPPDKDPPSPSKPKRPPAAKKPGPHRLKAPRKGKADDLTLIAGIGPDVRAKLNRLGIWHFEQIASWTPEDARIIAAELGAEANGADNSGALEPARAPAAWVDDAHHLATGWRPVQ